MGALDPEVAQESYGPKGQSSGVANTRLGTLATNLTGSYSCPSDNTEGSRPSVERGRGVGRPKGKHMVVRGCQGPAVNLKIRDE